MFERFDYTIEGNDVIFDIEVSEVVNVDYMDSADSKPKFNNLCRNKEVCQKAKSFKQGSHTLTLRAIDAAGNYADRQISLVI